MTQYILRRISISLPLLIAISIVTFFFMNLAPGDPVTGQADPELLATLSQRDLELQRKALGLDRSLPLQYVSWLGRISHGDFGYSYSTGRPVLEAIGERVLPTMELTLTSLVVSTVLGTAFGIFSALRQYSVFDYVLGLLSLFGVSIPTFFFALIALYLFAARWEIFPAYGMSDLTKDFTLSDNLYHLILPVTVLSIDTMAAKTRYARTAMLEVLHSDYMRTARAKGLGERVVIWRHGFRNALIPLITVTTLRLPFILGGAIIIEFMFSWPGMGLLSIESVFERDFTVLMGLTIIISSAVLFANLLADVLYAIVDPRIRYA